MKLIDKQKGVFLGLFCLSGVTGLLKMDDYLRRDGIPEDQKMTLIKKEVATRVVDLWSNDYGEGYLPAKEYRKLSFDTDNDTNTTEVVAFPEREIFEGIDETKDLKIGEEKTLDNWIDTLDEVCCEAKKKAPFSEKKDRIPIAWQFKKAINTP